MLIREATPNDIARITEIYNDAVLNTTAIWNETLVDEKNRLEWLATRQKSGYPVLVAVSADSDVIGYATFGDWRAFDGYRYTVEHSVYVHKDHRGAGIGKQMMIELIEKARGLGKHVMVAGIAADNTSSIALHEKLGFKDVGRLPQVGAKFGKWLDLAFLQLVLDEAAQPPK